MIYVVDQKISHTLTSFRISRSNTSMLVYNQRSSSVRIAAGAAIRHALSRQRRRPTRSSGTYKARKRQRRSVQDIYEILGPNYFKRAYRMSYTSFNKLAHNIQPFMKRRNCSKAANNGPILETFGWHVRFVTLSEAPRTTWQRLSVLEFPRSTKVCGKLSMQSTIIQNLRSDFLTLTMNNERLRLISKKNPVPDLIVVLALLPGY